MSVGPTRLLNLLVILIIVALNAIGLLLVVRRFAGALSKDLPPGAMLLTAIVAMAMVACTRIAWRRYFPLTVDVEELELSASGRLGDLLVGYGSSLSLVLLAVGCIYPAERTVDLIIWLPALVADQFWRQSFFDAGHPDRGAGETGHDLENELVLASLAMVAGEKTFAPEGLERQLAAAVGESGEGETEEIVQQLYRVRDELGQEVIYGTLRADFLAGQRTAVVHAGFCPPLSHLPEIEAESFRGPLARIKVVQALAHGTRMDVRLTAPAASDCHVWIDMAAIPATSAEKIQA
ncbi:MAG: hypothetical protein GXP26_03685 [Planctomycetes bacterium]|nr:hypothetical protein [Planctomycetota bacterium]